MARTLSLLLALTLAACNPSSTPPATLLPASPTALPPLPSPTLPPAPILIETSQPTPSLSRPAQPQIGLNFLSFYLSERQRGAVDTQTPFRQPDWIFADFRVLGIQAYRQFIMADLFWDIVEPQPGRFHFDQADAVIPNAEFEPIVTLFALQYASPTPPWETSPARFQKALGPEARAYLEQVIARYGAYLRYWEIGNEMDHWRAADPGAGAPPAGERLPLAPPDGFSPQEQGVFLAEAAAFIRARDPDAVIVLPGMSAPDRQLLNTWLAGVLEGGGTDWFDVVNYHYYGSWQGYCRQRQEMQAFLDQRGIGDKPVWLTETGATEDSSLKTRTDYPNSPQAQAADVFRRIVPAYALGDDLVLWHTYLDSPDLPGNDWRGYGIREPQSEAKLSYYALRLLIQELIPFIQAESLSCEPRGLNAFRFVRADGQERYIVWGSGSYLVPAGMSQMTGVVPDRQGNVAWRNVSAGEQIRLTEEPVILK